jgi:hypothetical protein
MLGLFHRSGFRVRSESSDGGYRVTAYFEPPPRAEGDAGTG